MDWIADLMRTAASAQGKTPAEVQLARLHRCDVQPLRVLIECAAVWAFAMRNPRTLPDDTRLTYALGIAVAYLAHRDYQRSYTYPSGERRVYRAVTSKGREQLGKELRQYLGPKLLRLMYEGIEAMAAKEARKRESLGVPFTNDNDGVTNA